MNDQVSLATLVQEKLDSDIEFQDSIASLSEDEQEAKIAEKRAELSEAMFAETHGLATKHGDLAKNYKTRAEKAEAELKGKKPEPGDGGEGGTPAESANADLSSTDLLAIIRADVHDDDVEKVKNAAKLLGKTIPEALKDEMVQGILKTRAEHRASANAMGTGAKRRPAAPPSDADVLEKAKAGEIPAPGTPEAEALYRARRGIPAK